MFDQEQKIARLAELEAKESRSLKLQRLAELEAKESAANAPKENGFARATGRGLRHVSVAINSLYDVPRGIADAASTLIRNKPFFDPEDKTHQQKAVEKIDVETKGALKPRSKNEEAWDRYAPAVLPAIVTRNPKAIIGAMTATKAADVIHDAENDPDSMFHNLSPREKLALISVAGGAGYRTARKGIRHIAGKADQGTLAAQAELNAALKESGKKPIRSGVSDYFPGGEDGSGGFTLSGGAQHGKAKVKHNQLKQIIYGEEPAAHLSSFFDERGFRKGAPAFVERPTVEFNQKKIIPKKDELQIVSEKPPIPAKALAEPIKPRSEWTQKEHLAELEAKLNEFNSPGFGPSSPMAMAYHQKLEKIFPGKYPHTKPEMIASVPTKSAPVKSASIKNKQEIVEPKYQIVKKETGTQWIKDKSAPEISFEDVSGSLANPKGHKVLKEFSHSLPDAASRNDAGRSLIQSLSPEGNWIEISQKFNGLPGMTKTEIINMLYPHDRASFKGAMHYSGRTLPKIQKEASPSKSPLNLQPFGAADISYALGTKGMSVPAKFIAKHGIPLVKRALSSLGHTKWAENLIRKNR